MSVICPGKGQGGNQGAQKRRKGSWGPWAPFPPFLRLAFDLGLSWNPWQSITLAVFGRTVDLGGLFWKTNEVGKHGRRMDIYGNLCGN